MFPHHIERLMNLEVINRTKWGHTNMGMLATHPSIINKGALGNT
jgi:hypothetical protein